MISGGRIGAEMQRVLLQQVLLESWCTAVVQVLLAGVGGVRRLQRLDDDIFAAIEGRLAGFLHAQIDQDFIIGSRTKALDARVLQSCAVHGMPDLVEVRSLRKLDVHQRAAAELHAQRNAMPEENGQQAGNAEDQ